MKTRTLFAACLASLAVTFTAWALTPCDQQADGAKSACQTKLVKVGGQDCTAQKSECNATMQTTQVAKVDSSDCDATAGCPVEAAARAYMTKVVSIQKASGKDFCAGGAAVKSLMAVLAENEEYRPMVAKFEAFMKQQHADAQPVAAKIETPAGDCDSPCEGTKAAKVASVKSDGQCSSTKTVVAKIDGSECSSTTTKVAKVSSSDCDQPCDGAKAAKVTSVKSEGECSSTKTVVAKVDGSECSSKTTEVAKVSSSDCAQPCDGDKAAKVASVKSDSHCSSTKTVVAKVDGSECSSKTTQVAKVSSDCSQSCDGAKGVAVAQVKSEGDCASSCESGARKAGYIAFGCDKSNGLARVAAKSYLNILMEIKKISGAEGCPMQTASETLAAVIGDLQRPTAQAAAVKTDGSVVTVSLGAASDCGSDCTKDCCKGS